MQHLSFVTVHPKLTDSYCSSGVFARATRAGVADFKSINLRNFAVDDRGSIDDRPYGGGDSMVLRPEPLRDAIKSITPKPLVIYTAPRGELWTQKLAQKFAREWFLDPSCANKPLAFVCGRFDGIDQRFIDQYVDHTFSLGNFVLAGGELACLAIVESILRLLPGVLGNNQSSIEDSFTLGDELEHPLYTRPQNFEGIDVPEVLLSGDHERIREWKLRMRQTK